MRGQLRAALISAALALVAVVAAAPASAAPAWKFNGSSLGGSEEIVDHALEGSLEFAGLTTTCEPFVYEMEIKNSAGTGIGTVTNVPLGNCFTDSVCTVEEIVATGLPWSASLTTVSSKHYIVIKGFKFTIVFGNPLCVLYETEVEVHGTAGGGIDNPSESAVFDAGSFSSTKTELLAFGAPVAWSGAFRMIAIGGHLGDTLSVG